LQVSPVNPRYLVDDSGEAVFLSGSNYWNTLQDGGTTNPPPAFNYDAWIDFLVARGMNCYKMYTWGHYWHQSGNGDWYTQPGPFARPGPGTALDGNPKWDLTVYNNAYFSRLRSRIMQAGDNGLYVIFNLFHGFSTRSGTYNTITGAWYGNPFNAANNINGINGDPTASGDGYDVHTLNVPAITAIQEALVKKYVDELGDLDNIIWEIALETDGTYTRDGHTCMEWQLHILDYLHTYEASQPNQHPLLHSVEWPGGNNTALISSISECFAPNGDDGGGDPLAWNGSKVLLTDTDHINWTTTDEHLPWRNLTRGAGGYIFGMDGGYSDYDDQGGGVTFEQAELLRYNMGYAVELAGLVDLIHTQPQNGGSSPCSTGYALYPSSGSYHEYLCFQPSNGNFTLNLSAESGTFLVMKINVLDGSIDTAQSTTGGASRTVTQPTGWTGGWAAWVRPQ
jgi:hypothetical protein